MFAQDSAIVLWRRKVGAGPCARISKGPHSLYPENGSSWRPTAMGPRALHALHTLAATPLPPYHRHLADEFLAPVFRPRGSRSSLLNDIIIVCRTRLSTVGDRAFPVAAAARVWNELPRHATSAHRPSYEFSDSRLKIHLSSRFFSDFV